MALVLGELATILKAQVEPFERDLRRARQAFNKHKDTLKAGAAVAGAAIAAGIGAGLVSAMNLSSAQAKLRNQLGDPVAAEAAGAAAAGSFGRGFTATLDEAMADASAVFASGLTGGDRSEQLIEDLTVKAQALSKTFEFDLTKAVGVAGVMLRDGLARDGSEALDLLAAASQRVAPQFREDILDAAHEYGTFFASLGFDGPQAFELLARGAEKGTYGIDKTGDVIKELTLIATDMSDKTKGAFNAIGLDSHKMANRLLAGGDAARNAFDQIINGLLAIEDPAKRANTAVELFGTPLEDMNKADIPAFLDSLAGLGAGMTDVSGKVGEMADTFEQDAGQKLQAFRNQVQAALIEKLAAAVPYLQATFGWLSENSDWVGPLATGLGVLAAAIALIVGALKVWAAVQVVLNLALWTSPITWIVLGVIALVAAIVWVATQTTWFQDIWNAAWGGIKAAAEFVWTWIKDNWPLLLAIITGPIGLAVLVIVKNWDKIKSAAGSAKDWIVNKMIALGDFIRSMPGRISRAASGMFNGIKNAFRSAINWIIGKWNGLSFSIPSVNIPGLGTLGGGTLSTPNIPYLASGGDVLRDGLAVIHRGERVVPAAQVSALPGGGGHAEAIQLTGEFRVRGDDLVLVLRERIDTKGGNVQAVLGRGNRGVA